MNSMNTMQRRKRYEREIATAPLTLFLVKAFDLTLATQASCVEYCWQDKTTRINVAYWHERYTNRNVQNKTLRAAELLIYVQTQCCTFWRLKS